MNNDIKVGICQWSLPGRLSGPGSFEILSRYGLEGIELDLGAYEEGFPLANEIIQEAYKKAGNKHDLEFPSLAVNELNKYGMTNATDSKKRRIAITAINTAIDVAEFLNISIIQLPSFEDGEIESVADFQNTVEILQHACDAAAGKGLVIGTENLLSIKENKRLLDEVNRDNLKIYFDLQNYKLFEGYNTPKMIEELYPYICEIHAKDGENRMSESLLGEGKAGFNESVETLKERGYSGWFQLENYYFKKPLSDRGNPFDLLSRDNEYLRKNYL